MKTDNQYLKSIAEKTGSETDGFHTNNYYLKKIEENIGGGSSSAFDTIEVTITYEDNTTQTVNLVIQPSSGE